MELTSKRIYCFIENYESGITHILSLTISLCLIRLYFNNTESGNFVKLTPEEKRKLKEADRRISQALRLSKSTSTIFKVRGGSISPITPITRITTKHILSKLARLIVEAIKDGSVHALALIIVFNVHPKSEKLIRAICLGDNTDAIIAEIANNMSKKRRIIIQRMIMSKEIRKSINTILLELELIKKPLTQLELFRLAAYSITAFEVPIVKGAIYAARGMMVMFITNKMKQVLVSQLTKQLANALLTAFLSSLTSGAAPNLCGTERAQIEQLKQGFKSISTIGGIKAPESSVTSNILSPTFNNEIIDFIDIDPVVERLTGSSLIPYSPKFNVDYVIERLVIGHDISKLPRDHITNLW